MITNLTTSQFFKERNFENFPLNKPKNKKNNQKYNICAQL